MYSFDNLPDYQFHFVIIITRGHPNHPPMSMKFSQIKVQRALRRLELSNHPSYMPFPKEPNETHGLHDIHIQLRPDLPRNSQPAAQTVRNGTIYMKSRNVPGKGIKPGMVLLLDLSRAASVLADDTYEVASEEDIAVELARQDKYRTDMADRDRTIRMQNNGVENNINISPAQQAPINVTIAWPEGMELVPKSASSEAPAAPIRRRGKSRTTAVAPVEAPESPVV